MSFFSKIAHTLGGAASGLAHGVAAAAQVSGKAFTSVTQSSAWKIAATAVGTAGNLVLPGVAAGISAGMLTASKIGQAASSKDAIISAAKDELMTPEQKSAFDIGTGIAVHGAGMAAQDLEKVRVQIKPGAPRAAFDSALVLHAGRVTARRPAPPHLPPSARAAYYATKGLVHTDAPHHIKKHVLHSIARSPSAKQAVALANRTAPRDETYLQWFFRTVHAKLTGHDSGKIAVHGEWLS